MIPAFPTESGRPLRVLLVTARYFPDMGGVETHVYEVARRMAQAGVDVTVLATDRTGRLPAHEETEGVHVRRVRAWPANRDYYFAPGVYRVVARGNWDVVHCQGYHTLVPPLAMLAALRTRRPYVLTFHSGGHSSAARNAARGVQRLLLRPLLRRAARLIGVSRFEADFFREQLHLPRKQFVVIPNGSQLPAVDLSAPAEDTGTLIVSTGRLERYKGHQRVIAALPEVLAQVPDAHLQIVGSGPYEMPLRQLAEELGVAERVNIGSIPAADRHGMATLLSRAALVTLLSDYEAHAIAVLEALALGRPVLVTDTSGLHEFAERGEARAIPLDSGPTAVAAAILEQLRAPIRPDTVHVPTWEACTAQILAVYRGVVAGAARHRPGR